MAKIEKPKARKKYKCSKCGETIKEGELGDSDYDSLTDEAKEDVPAQGRRMGIYEARALFDGHPRPKFVGD